MKVASDLARPGAYNSTPTTECILAIFHWRSAIRTCLPDIPQHFCHDRLIFTCLALYSVKGKEDTKLENGGNVNVHVDHYKPLGHHFTGNNDANAETMFGRCLLTLCFCIQNIYSVCILYWLPWGFHPSGKMSGKYARIWYGHYSTLHKFLVEKASLDKPTRTASFQHSVYFSSHYYNSIALICPWVTALEEEMPFSGKSRQ